MAWGGRLRTARMGRKDQTYIKLGCLGLLMALLLCTGIALAADGEAFQGALNPQLSASPSEPDGRELEAKRTATSNTFALPDGRRETRIYEAPINFRNQEGDWQPIDEGLSSAGTGVANGDNRFDVHLPKRMGEGPVKLTVGDKWVSESFLSRPTEAAEIEHDETASFETADGDLSFEFSTFGNGLKEEIEATDLFQANDIRFELSASAGVEPAITSDGSIEFRGGDGHLVAALPAPLVADDSGMLPVGAPITYQLEQHDSTHWMLRLQISSDWLHAPDRAWPIHIDPTLQLPSLPNDCVFGGVSGSWGWSTCGALGQKTMYGAYIPNLNSPAQDEWIRTALRFDLKVIPADALVDNAELRLYSSVPTQNTDGIGIYPIPYNDFWTGQINFRTYDGVNWWQDEGGDFDIEQGSEIATSQRGTQAGWWNFADENFRRKVQVWVANQASNQGVILRQRNDRTRLCSPTSCNARWFAFDSTAATDPAHRPYMSVTWYPPASSDSKVTSPSDGAKTAKRIRLVTAWEHSGVEGVKYQYRVNADGWTEIPASQVIDQSNQSVTWPYKIPQLTDRQSRPLYWDASSVTGGAQTASLQIRAILTGQAGADGYTRPVSAEIDKDVGGPKDATVGIGPGAVDLLTGNFTVTRKDVMIPGFGALEFSRSISSRQPGVEANGVLGPGWKPAAPVEEAGGSSWRSIKLESFNESWEEENEAEEIEQKSFIFKWAQLSDFEGGELSFEEISPGVFKTPDELGGFLLASVPGHPSELSLVDPSGNRTVFSNEKTGNNEYIPISVTTSGGSQTRMVYEFPEAGKKRLKEVIAPSLGITCPDLVARTKEGCHVLSFNYGSVLVQGQPKPRLTGIVYYAQGSGGPWEVAHYEYDADGRLFKEWDPRITPTLGERYSYEPKGQLRALTPPGQESWVMEYGTVPGETANGRLSLVKRGSPGVGNPPAQTTLGYGVPLNGIPYNMTGEAVAKWGQTDLPTDATAIFPANEIPSSPPASYARATVYYLDADGQIVNVATPSGAGTSAPSITTTETDRFGNVIRELSAQNRLRALAAGNPADKSRELDTQFFYSVDGTELQEEKGPAHQVRLSSGTVSSARLYRSIQYNNPAPPAGTPAYHLPTSETSGALVGSNVFDQRTTKYDYNWALRKRTETVTDPNGLSIVSKTVYNSFGQPIEIRQPKDLAGNTAGTTNITYWTPGGPACFAIDKYAGLPCYITHKGSQPTAGTLPYKRITAYSPWGAPSEIDEVDPVTQISLKTTKVAYDGAGRVKTWQVMSGGKEIPKVETLYDETKGLPIGTQFICPATEPGCDQQKVRTEFDTLGRPISYEDADGGKTETTYNLMSQPVMIKDGKGSETITYDPVAALPVELVDSAAGKFTATYNADGDQVTRTMPNGLTAETTVNEAGEPTRLTYNKASLCGASCTWLDFSAERSIFGQILSESGTQGTNLYGYDKAGRLILAEETPAGGSCTTKEYTYDADSNRTSSTRIPGAVGACVHSGGATQNYAYDTADRLMATGLSYDNFGRITKLPASLAGGSELATSYFANDMVAVQTQGGVSNSFTLDSALRQSARLQGGGLEGTEVFHYDNDGDGVSWTQRGAAWTRNIGGIGGELAATQDSGGEVTLQLTNLHGDVAATAALSPSVTSLKASFRYDEFGNPAGGTAGRFSWLGGKMRRTELSSGVTQMGVRSYVPQIGRFLTPDPVFGGSANAYDYAGQDPINNFDLTGECYVTRRPSPGKCKKSDMTPGNVRKAGRREARAHRVRAVGICSRCSTTRGGVVAEVGNFGSGALKTVFSKEIDVLAAGHGSPDAAWSDVKDAVGLYISSFSAPYSNSLWSCARGAAEGFREARAVAAASEQPELAYGYAAIRCLVAGLGS